jgi:hypothetical protein
MARKLAAGLVLVLCVSSGLWAGSYATEVVSYDPGTGAVPGYTDPAAVLGAPARTTSDWPTTNPPVAVRMTEAQWDPGQLLTIGSGGSLVVGFDHNVLNDPQKPYGIDLLVFTNTFFATQDYPANTLIDAGAYTFLSTLGQISVSQDGAKWYKVDPAKLGTMFPTQAYQSEARDGATAGAALTDFTRPVNPSLSYANFAGLTVTQGLALYNGSGGGLGIDLSNLLDDSNNPAGLDWIRYVKVEGSTNALDGFADVSVPEPATLTLLGVGLAGLAWRRKR